MVYYFVNECFDIDGETIYDSSKIIGIYDNFETAKNELLKKIKEFGYEYEISPECKNYLFMKTDYGYNDGKILCYEIIENKTELGKINIKRKANYKKRKIKI